MATDGQSPADSGPQSEGDIRVLIVLDLIFSLVFSVLVVYGLDFVGLGEFTPQNVVIATLFLAAVTYAAVLR